MVFIHTFLFLIAKKYSTIIRICEADSAIKSRISSTKSKLFTLRFDDGLINPYCYYVNVVIIQKV